MQNTTLISKRKLIYFFFNFLLSIIFHQNTYGQNEGNIWYFGNEAGLDFNSGSPVALTDGQLNTLEGCATISDAGGNLLFYTDGILVWNKNHIIMPNGTGLIGDPSSTQSGVIVPHPSNSDLYYIFSVGAECGGALAYTLVNITLDGGLGDVVTSQKNITLIPNALEKITSVKHANGTDIWVVGHEIGNNTFHSYLISASGVNTSPMITNIGLTHPSGPFGCRGYLKASTDGSKIAIALESERDWELFDFNNATGILSNAMTFLDIGHKAYGIEFSPDLSKIYISSCWNNSFDPDEFHISQYDLDLNTFVDIEASQTTVAQGIGEGGALQLAPDGKIYFCRAGTNQLAVINQPNLLGINCSFQDNAVNLGSGTVVWGLPTFIQSYFANSISVENFCLGDITEFSLISYGSSIASYHWDFGDGNTSSLSNPSHVYTSSGTFTVTLTVNLSDGNTLDRVREITITPPLQLSSNILGKDTVCLGESIIYQVDNVSSATGYKWTVPAGITILSDSSFTENPEILLEFGQRIENQSIWVKAVNECFESDSIQLDIFMIPVPELISDTLCVDLGENTFNIPNSAYIEEYTWVLPEGVSIIDNTNATTPNLLVNVSEDFTEDTLVVIASNSCGETVEQNYWLLRNPMSLRVRDSLTCGFLIAESELANVNYQWYKNGEIIPDAHERIYKANESGTYSIKFINFCEEEFESNSYVFIKEDCSVNLFLPEAFTPNNDGINDVFEVFGSNVIKLDIRIYNRWGEVVYILQSLEDSWDGVSRGQLAPSGTYVYKGTYVDVVSNEKHHVQGKISLIR